MELTQLIFTILISSLFCLGWNIITSEGNLLYFIRKPFNVIYDSTEPLENRISLLYMNLQLLKVSCFEKDNTLKEIGNLKRALMFHKIINFFAKPVIHCITCYGSVWGATVFIALNGFAINNIHYIIINSVAVAFVNTFIYKIYSKL